MPQVGVLNWRTFKFFVVSATEKSGSTACNKPSKRSNIDLDTQMTICVVTSVIPFVDGIKPNLDWASIPVDRQGKVSIPTDAQNWWLQRYSLASCRNPISWNQGRSRLDLLNSLRKGFTLDSFSRVIRMSFLGLAWKTGHPKQGGSLEREKTDCHGIFLVLPAMYIFRSRVLCQDTYEESYVWAWLDHLNETSWVFLVRHLVSVFWAWIHSKNYHQEGSQRV